MTQPRRSHILYRFYNDADELLYVGITANLNQRLEKHRAEKEWWPEVSRIGIEHFADRQSILAAERNAITNEQPRHNIHLNKGGSPIARALVADEDIDGLIGRTFHSWREPRQDEDTRYATVRRGLVLEWQGHVLDRIETGLYLVELYSWWDGSPNGQRLIPVQAMTKWTFYDDALEMRVALGCPEQSESGRDCGSEITHVIWTALGAQLTCWHHSEDYSGKRQKLLWVDGKPQLP